MQFGELKPILSTLVLPPAGPLLLIALAALLAFCGRRRGVRVAAWLAAFAGTASLWLLSCHAVAVWLSATLLPPAALLAPAHAARELAAQQVQAIVVLGGGVQGNAPEYGSAQPSSATWERLHYGVFLAKASGLPMAFAGGVGWANAGTGVETEAAAAATALQGTGATLRWSDGDSRDTAENAQRLRDLLQKDGVKRIALVTHAWHMPRSRLLFERAGFTVVQAPTGFISADGRALLEWLPGAGGLQDSRAVLREWLALQLL